MDVVETYRESSYGRTPTVWSSKPSKPRRHHSDIQLLLSRWPREAAAQEEEKTLEIPAYCDRFNMPNEKNNTFFSPLDPTSNNNTYPKNAECTHVLTGEFIAETSL